MLEAPPPPALEMIQPEFVLEFLVVALDAPPQLREADEVSDRDRLRQRRQPVLRRLGVALGPLDQQPLFGPGRGALFVAMRRPDAEPCEPRAHRPPGAFAPRHNPPGGRRQFGGQLAETDGSMRSGAPDAARGAAPSPVRLRRPR